MQRPRLRQIGGDGGAFVWSNREAAHWDIGMRGAGLRGGRNLQASDQRPVKAPPVAQEGLPLRRIPGTQGGGQDDGLFQVDFCVLKVDFQKIQVVDG